MKADASHRLAKGGSSAICGMLLKSFAKRSAGIRVALHSVFLGGRVRCVSRGL